MHPLDLPPKPPTRAIEVGSATSMGSVRAPRLSSRMTPIRRGAVLLAAILGAVLLCNVLSLVSQSVASQTRPSFGQLLGLIVQALVFHFVLVGQPWARWLTLVVGTVAGAACGTLFVFALVGGGKARVSGFLFAGAVLWSTLVLVLTLPNPVTRYLASRRA